MKKVYFSKGLKKAVCIALLFALIVTAIVFPVPAAADISYTEPSDLKDGLLLDFSSKNVLVGSNTLIDGSSVKTSDESTLELQKEQRVAGWSWSIFDDGGNKRLRTAKKDNTTYSTSGALRINADNSFCILKPQQAYYLSFKYKVVSSQKTFNKNGVTYPLETHFSSLKIGYGSNLGKNVDIGNRMGSIVTELATVVNIGNNTNKFTHIDDKGVEYTKNVGEWYTMEIQFSTPAVFASESQHLAFCATLYSGTDIYIDDFYIEEVDTVTLNLCGGRGVEIKQGAVVGKEINFGTPVREGYVFAGWYEDLYYNEKFTDTVFNEENTNSVLYAKWESEYNIFAADFCDYETGSEQTGDLRQNVVLTDKTFTSHNFTFADVNTEDGRKKLLFDGYEDITSANRAYFPLGNINGNFKLKSNTTYVILVDYAMTCAMSGSPYDLKLLTAAPDNIDDTPVTIFNQRMPSGDYREFITFTTGEIADGKNVPFLEISYKHSNVVTVTFNMVKLIQIDDGMNYIRAYNNKDNEIYEFLGHEGQQVNFPVLESTATVDFSGWYTDETFTQKHSGKFSNEKLSYVYSYWENKPVDFEKFVPFLDNSYYTVGKDINITQEKDSYSGEKCLKYIYQYEPNYFNGPYNSISSAIVYDKTTYKISFMYSLKETVGDVDVKFFTAHRTNRFTYVTNYDNATYRIYSSEANEGWKQATVYLTTDFVKQEHSDGMHISFNPLIEGATELWIDDIKFETVSSGVGTVAFLGKDGKWSGIYETETVGTAVIAPETQPQEYFAAFDGWYTDEACTVPFGNTTVKRGITYVYSKWTENKENFEGYLYENAHVTSDGTNKALNNGAAVLGRVEDDSTYLVTYRFKTNKAGTKIYFKTADSNKNLETVYTDDGSVLTVSQALSDGNWHTAKAYINTAFCSDENGIGDILYAVAEGEISVDDIALQKTQVVYNGGSAVLKDQAAEQIGLQAMRFFFSYESENAATVKVNGETLTLTERGVVLKDATVTDGGAITIQKAENGVKGYAKKSINYGFGNYWEYKVGAAENKIYAAYESYPPKINAATTDSKEAALPSTDENGAIEYSSDEHTIGESYSQFNESGDIVANGMPKTHAGEDECFVGSKDAKGSYVTEQGDKMQPGEVVYSYYISSLKKQDTRNIGAKGYIKAKDADGNVYTFYSCERISNVSDVKSVAACITDKKVHTISGNNWNRFTIVNPKIMPYIYGEEIENLISYAADTHSVKLERVTEKAKELPYEIIIGDTTREQSSFLKAGGENSYIIGVRGTKLIIKGGSDIATKQAVSDFIEILKFYDSLGCGVDLYDGFTLQGEYTPSSDNYVLAFNEDFNSLDTTIWKSYAGYDYGYFYSASVLGGSIGHRSISGREVLTKSGESKNLVRVEDGNLILGTAWITPTEPKDIENNVEFIHSDLSTFYTMLYMYGMLEIRADVGEPPATLSLWVNGGSSFAQGVRRGCMTEYDLIENYGRNNYFASCIHHWSDNLTTGNLDHFGQDEKYYTGNLEQGYKPDFDENAIYDSYHIYTFVWEDDRIVFAFDGVKYCEYEIPEWYKENMANCLILSQGMGDANYGEVFDPSKHKDYYQTLIDYVRIYQIEDMGSKIYYAQ